MRSIAGYMATSGILGISGSRSALKSSSWAKMDKSRERKSSKVVEFHAFYDNFDTQQLLQVAQLKCSTHSSSSSQSTDHSDVTAWRKHFCAVLAIFCCFSWPSGITSSWFGCCLSTARSTSRTRGTSATGIASLRFLLGLLVYILTVSRTRTLGFGSSGREKEEVSILINQ